MITLNKTQIRKHTQPNTYNKRQTCDCFNILLLDKKTTLHDTLFNNVDNNTQKIVLS